MTLAENKLQSSARPVLEVRDLVFKFDDVALLNGISLDLLPKEILGVAGGSGSGKTVLMRTILGLVKKTAGNVRFFGYDMSQLSRTQYRIIEQHVGVLFQHGALFSSLTVMENIQLPMREYLQLSPKLMNEIALIKMQMVGLEVDAAWKYPAQLSGGMIKRAALARALALDPDILFLDEPTSGLDPVGAHAFNQLILKLKDTLGLSVYIITHDLDSLHQVCDRIAMLKNGKIAALGSIEEIGKSSDTWIKSFFLANENQYKSQ